MTGPAQRRRQGWTPASRGAARRLPAKLAGRSAADVVERERLFQRIDRHAARPLLWVQGPAGAGKTALVASYVARRRLHPLWYRVDAGDIDAATIFSYLARGAAAVTRKRSASLPALTPEYLLDAAGFARRFFRTFFDTLPPRAVVVFDNAENAPGEALHQLLLVAAAELPPGQRIVVTSRDAPAERLSHLPAKGAMDVIGWDDLRLTDDEALAVAGGSGSGSCDDAAVARLHRAADGWTAGFLVLLAHARGSSAGAGPAAPAAASQQLFAYYLNEIFASADAALQTLLTHTALLPSFSVAQAAALTPGTDAVALLGRLLRRHFFISRSSGGPEAVYTYHPLFRAFLLRHGGEQIDSNARRGLLQQSATLLLGAGEAEAALDLLVQAGAREQAAGVLCRLAPRLLEQGRSATLLQSIAALPAGTSAFEHWLCYWRGMALLASAPPQARAELESAYAGFDASGDAVGRLLACASILDSYLHGFSDMRPVDAWGAALQRLLHDAGPLPSEVEVRVLTGFPVLIFRGHVHARMVDEGRARALALLHRLDDPALRMATACFVLLVLYLGGEWHAGRRFIAEIDPTLPPPSVLPAYAAFWQAMNARLMVWDGDAAAAVPASAQAERIAADHNTVTLAAISASAGVFASLNLDDAAQAGSFLRRMQAGVLPSRRLDVATLDLQSGMLALLQGQPRQAAADLQAALAKALAQGAELLAAQFRIVLALALADTGQAEAAAQALLQVDDYAAAASNPMLHHSALMVRAWLALRGGAAAAALELLREALPLGRRNGYRVVFPWVPLALLQDLGLLALQHGVEPDHVRDMLRLRRVPPPGADADTWPWRMRVTTLGRFALEIDGSALGTAQKAPKKTLELLRALVALASGGGVALATVQQHLWPDLDGAAAHNACSVALHRLRKLLGDEQAVVVHDGRVRLDGQRVWSDAESFGCLADRIDQTGCTTLAQPLLRIYRGHFLVDDEAPWALVQRERLRSRFLRAATVLAARLEADAQLEAAVDLQRRVIEIDPLAEVFHRSLVRCLLKLDRRSEALDAYQRCKTLLQTLVNSRPSWLMEPPRRPTEP